MSELYIQNNFSHGELDPRMFAQVDLQTYYKTAKRLRNVYIRPQGGAIKRHGSLYQDIIDTPSGEYQLAEFILLGDVEYLLVFKALEIDVYKKDATTGVLSKVHTITTTITADQVVDIQTAQNGNFMVITEPTMTTLQLTNGGSDTSWTLAAITFKNYPAFDFTKDYYADTFTLASVKVAKNIVLTCSAAVFTAEHVGGLFISIGAVVTSPVGAARIISVPVGPYPVTTCTVDIISEFDASLGAAGASGNHCFLGEPAFSATRGWPGSCTFYEDRLCFGATTELPQTLFLSKVGDFPNFDQGQGLDDEGIVYTLSADSFNKIEYVVSDKSLQIFCNESEFSSMQYFAEPLTPSSASFRKQSGVGCSEVKPAIVDNQTFFVREGGKSVMAFVYDANSTSYTALNASLFSAILINNPVSMAVLKGDGIDDADYLFAVNQDGSLLVYQSLAQESVSAWTICATQMPAEDLENQYLAPNRGKYKKVLTVKNKVYAIIERTIPGGTFEYLELLSFSTNMDSATVQTFTTPRTSIGNLIHLEGETVKIIADGVLLNDQVVTNGSVTLTDPVTNATIGLGFPVLIETIPAYLAGSNRLYVPKRIIRAFIDYFESLGIFVDGYELPDLIFGPNVLDQPIQPQTGVAVTHPENWKLRPTIQITQKDPLPLLLIGVGYEVE